MNEPTAGDLLLAERVVTFRNYEDAATLIREHVERETAELQATITECESAVAEVYCAITGGRFSKMNTRPEVILSEVERIRAEEVAAKDAVIAKLVAAGNALADSLAPGPIPASEPTERDYLLADWEAATGATPDSAGAELAQLRKDKARFEWFFGQLAQWRAPIDAAMSAPTEPPPPPSRC